MLALPETRRRCAVAEIVTVVTPSLAATTAANAPVWPTRIELVQSSAAGGVVPPEARLMSTSSA